MGDAFTRRQIALPNLWRLGLCGLLLFLASFPRIGFGKDPLWDAQARLLGNASNLGIWERIRNGAEYYKFLAENGSRIDRHLVDYVRLRDKGEVSAIEERLRQGDIVNDQRMLAYFCLIMAASIVEKPGETYVIYRKLKKEFPSSLVWKVMSESYVKRLKWAESELKIIKSGKLSPSESLWRLSEVRGFLEDLNYPDVYGAGGLPIYRNFDCLKRIVKEYPNSEWSDDAEYYMLSFSECWIEPDDEDSQGMDCVYALSRFIQKYPKSNMRPDAMVEMAAHYYGQISGGWNDYYGPGYEKDERRKYLDLARPLLQEVREKYRRAEVGKRANRLWWSMDSFVDEISWMLNISEMKTAYAIGEKIIVRFELKRTGGDPKEIIIDKSGVATSFSVSVLKREANGLFKDVHFERDATGTVADMAERRLNPGETYWEDRDIAGLVSRGRYESFGMFSVKVPGIYKIHASLELRGKAPGFIFSNDLLIEIVGDEQVGE